MTSPLPRWEHTALLPSLPPLPPHLTSDSVVRGRPEIYETTHTPTRSRPPQHRFTALEFLTGSLQEGSHNQLNLQGRMYRYDADFARTCTVSISITFREKKQNTYSIDIF